MSWKREYDGFAKKWLRRSMKRNDVRLLFCESMFCGVMRDTLLRMVSAEGHCRRARDARDRRPHSKGALECHANEHAVQGRKTRHPRTKVISAMKEVAPSRQNRSSHAPRYCFLALADAKCCALHTRFARARRFWSSNWAPCTRLSTLAQANTASAVSRSRPPTS